MNYFIIAVELQSDCRKWNCEYILIFRHEQSLYGGYYKYFRAFPVASEKIILSEIERDVEFCDIVIS